MTNPTKILLVCLCVPIVSGAQQSVYLSAPEARAGSSQDRILISSAADPAASLPSHATGTNAQAKPLPGQPLLPTGVVGHSSTPAVGAAMQAATIPANAKALNSRTTNTNVNTAQALPGQPLLPTGVVARPAAPSVSSALPSYAVAVHTTSSATHAAGASVSSAFSTPVASTSHASTLNAHPAIAAGSASVAASASPVIGSALTTPPAVQHGPSLLRSNILDQSRQSRIPAKRYQLDLVVTDGYGRPISGLSAQDLVIKDNEKPREIQSFHAVTETMESEATTTQQAAAVSRHDPAVELILLFDAVNTDTQHLDLIRTEAEKFLRQNDGQLTQPTSLVLFSSNGITTSEHPTLNGNNLADLLAQYGANLQPIPPITGRTIASERARLSEQTLKDLIDGEAKLPGRKQLLWIGPGWPLLRTGEIAALTDQLREARMAVYNIRFIRDDGTIDSDYEDYLQGVSTNDTADNTNLTLQLLALNSGGRILDTINDVVGQIARCESDARAYYTVSFNSNDFDSTNPYHQLDVQVNQRGLNVRASTTYKISQ